MDFVVSVLGNGVKLISQDTVPLSIWCAANYADSFEEALWTAVSALGDRDTICAIVGSIVILNDSNIPHQWEPYIEKLEESVFLSI